jgi:hypothetical protein
LDSRNTPPGPARRSAHARRPGEPRVFPPPAQHHGPPARSPRPPAQHHGRQPGTGKSGGAEGNERLTALTGTVLLLLLAAEGVTLLQLGRLLTLHFFIGMLLLGPVALKASSTIYRFVRYYTGSAPYRRKGPPAPLLRLLGPVIIASTAGVFGSGIALAIAGPSGREPWLFLHKGSFVVWFCAMAVHVLAYLPRLPRLLSAEFRGSAAAGREYGGEYAVVHPSQRHTQPGYPDRNYPAQGYRDGGYPAQGSRDRGYPAEGYPAQGYRDGGYPDGGYPAQGYRDGDYPAQGYRDGGYPDGAPRNQGYTGRAAAILGGRGVRLSLLAASLLVGLVIAMLTVHLATPWHIFRSG